MVHRITRYFSVNDGSDKGVCAIAAHRPQTTMTHRGNLPVDELDKRIINTLQDGFPVCDQPFAVAAKNLEMDESVLIDRIGTLLEENMLSRFGPLFNMDRIGGAYSLAAMKVPAEVFEKTAQLVNSFPEIAHNYERDHEFNMWFVLASDSVEQLQHVIDKIENATGLHVYNMPKQKEYYVGLKFHV